VAARPGTTDLLLAETGGWPFVRITDDVRFADAPAYCRCQRSLAAMYPNVMAGPIVDPAPA
jgi:hypothetical protein